MEVLLPYLDTASPGCPLAASLASGKMLADAADGEDFGLSERETEIMDWVRKGQDQCRDRQHSVHQFLYRKKPLASDLPETATSTTGCRLYPRSSAARAMAEANPTFSASTVSTSHARSRWATTCSAPLKHPRPRSPHPLAVAGKRRHRGTTASALPDSGGDRIFDYLSRQLTAAIFHQEAHLRCALQLVLGRFAAALSWICHRLYRRILQPRPYHLALGCAHEPDWRTSCATRAAPYLLMLARAATARYHRGHE